MKIIRLLLLAVLAVTSCAVSAETFTTTKCAAFKHPEIQFEVSNPALPKEDAAWLVDLLETGVAAGKVFPPGDTFQVGWTIDRIRPGPDGNLMLTEPDMASMPVRYIDSMDQTLLQLRSQREALLSVDKDLAPQFPRMDQTALVHKNVIEAKHIVLARSEPRDDRDSGWFITDLDDMQGLESDENFDRVSLYEIGIRRPDLVKLFAFPEEYTVVVDRGRVSVGRGNKKLPLREGSFLSELNKRLDAR